MGAAHFRHYIIGRDGTIIYAYMDADYRDRADPEEVLMFLKEASMPAEGRRPKTKGRLKSEGEDPSDMV